MTTPATPAVPAEPVAILRRAMDRANIPADYRAAIVGFFCNEWNASPPLAARRLAKHQPCGCVICTCDDEEQCRGCGAKHCGAHPIGELPHPLHEPVAEHLAARPVVALSDNDIERMAAEFIAEDWTPNRYYRNMDIVGFAHAIPPTDARQERERCAKIALRMCDHYPPAAVAAVIREGE